MADNEFTSCIDAMDMLHIGMRSQDWFWGFCKISVAYADHQNFNARHIAFFKIALSISVPFVVTLNIWQPICGEASIKGLCRQRRDSMSLEINLEVAQTKATRSSMCCFAKLQRPRLRES